MKEMAEDFLQDLKARVEKIETQLQGGTSHAPRSHYSLHKRRVLQEGSSRIVEGFANYRAMLEGNPTTTTKGFARIKLKKNSPFSFSIQKPAGYYSIVKRNIPKMLSRTLFLINQYKYTYARYKNADTRNEMAQISRYLNVWKTYIQDYLTFMYNTFGHLVGLKHFNFSNPESAKVAYMVVLALYTQGYGQKDVKDVLPALDQDLYDMLSENLPALYAPKFNAPEDMPLSNEFVQKLFDKIEAAGDSFALLEEEKELYTYIFKNYLSRVDLSPPTTIKNKKTVFVTKGDGWEKFKENLKSTISSLKVYLEKELPNSLKSIEHKVLAPLYSMVVPLEDLKLDLPAEAYARVGKALVLTNSNGDTVVLKDSINFDSLMENKITVTLLEKPEKTQPVILRYHDSNKSINLEKRIRTSSRKISLKGLPLEDVKEELLSVKISGIKAARDQYEIHVSPYIDLSSLDLQDLFRQEGKDNIERKFNEMLKILETKAKSIDPEASIDLKKPSVASWNKDILGDLKKEYSDVIGPNQNISMRLFAKNRLGISLRTLANFKTPLTKAEVIFEQPEKSLNQLDSNPLYLLGKQLELKTKILMKKALKMQKEHILDPFPNKKSREYSIALKNYHENMKLVRDHRLGDKDENILALEERLNSLGAMLAFGLIPDREKEDVTSELEETLTELKAAEGLIEDSAGEATKEASIKNKVSLGRDALNCLNEKSLCFVYGSVEENLNLAKSLKKYFPMDNIQDQFSLMKEYLDATPSTRKNSSVDVVLVKNGLYDLYHNLLVFYNRKPSKPPLQLTEYLPLEESEDQVSLFLVTTHSLGE